MSIPGKVLIALLSSLLVSAAAGFIEPSYSFVSLLLPTAAAAVASVVLSHRSLPVPEVIASEAPGEQDGARAVDKQAEAKGRQRSRSDSGNDSRSDAGNARERKARGDRRPADKPRRGESAAKSQPSGARGEAEEGTVKWFNVSKGYGFIIRGSGEEIFVHHRSVYGEGRGRLEDGARVRFRVATTDKGPQAEDVEPL